MCAYSDVAYVGTFSSISVIINKDKTVFNDSLTAYANFMYDSVIRSRVRNITAYNTISSLNSSQLRSLTEELTKNVLAFNHKAGLASIPCSKMDSVASLYPNRYTSYFIDFGNIWSKKQNRKYLAGQTLLISAVVIGFAVLVVLTAAAGDSGHNDFISSSHDNDGSTYHWYGMNCYYLIYDKQEQKVCYLNSAFFNSDKTDNNPFNPQRVGNQLQQVFNNCLK